MPVEDTLAERQTNYGDFSDNAQIAQALKDILRLGPMWQACPPWARQAMDVMCDKLSRIVAGKNPLYKDNWHDIQGYAKLAEERCTDAL